MKLDVHILKETIKVFSEAFPEKENRISEIILSHDWEIYDVSLNIPERTMYFVKCSKCDQKTWFDYPVSIANDVYDIDHSLSCEERIIRDII